MVAVRFGLDDMFATWAVSGLLRTSEGRKRGWAEGHGPQLMLHAEVESRGGVQAAKCLEACSTCGRRAARVTPSRPAENAQHYDAFEKPLHFSACHITASPDILNNTVHQLPPAPPLSTVRVVSCLSGPPLYILPPATLPSGSPGSRHLHIPRLLELLVSVFQSIRASKGAILSWTNRSLQPPSSLPALLNVDHSE
ncbi:hypothetical protein BFW01_g12145 [Lasiodiplodia theobromae]|nr:hypothetical protein BFW01_g12145 [Lasiodiplodia theobromae]